MPLLEAVRSTREFFQGIQLPVARFGAFTVESQKEGNKRLLLVDDDAQIRRLIRLVLKDRYDIEESDGSDSVPDLCLRFRPHIVLLDIGLPRVDGFSICRSIKRMDSIFSCTVVIISGRSSNQDLELAIDQGADDYLVKPLDSTALLARLQLHEKLIDAREAARFYSSELTNQSSRLTDIIESRRQEQQAIQDAAIFTLAKVAESRDNETGNHLIRISEFSGILASALVDHPDVSRRLTNIESLSIPRLSTLHDIGKVGIPDSILLKPGKLDPEEWRIMQSHTIIGWEILEEAVRQFPSASFLRGAALIAKYHHERWDGTGYPCGLKGDDIPLAARIIALADVFDALTTDRPYRAAWECDRTRDHIIEGSGSHFDPALVEVFIDRYEDFKRVHHIFAEASTPVFQYVLNAQASLTASPIAAGL